MNRGIATFYTGGGGGDKLSARIELAGQLTRGSGGAL